MNNEEKVKEIAHNLITNQVQDDWWYPRAQEHYEEALMEMAQWKDEQFKRIVKDYIDLAYSSGQEANLLEDILREL